LSNAINSLPLKNQSNVFTSDIESVKLVSKTVNKKVISKSHPLIPKLYVQTWRTDMKNRRLISQNAKLAGYDVIHKSLHLDNREHLSATEIPTNHDLKQRKNRLKHANKSHLSMYNSSLLYRSHA